MGHVGAVVSCGRGSEGGPEEELAARVQHHDLGGAEGAALDSSRSRLSGVCRGHGRLPSTLPPKFAAVPGELLFNM